MLDEDVTPGGETPQPSIIAPVDLFGKTTTGIDPQVTGDPESGGDVGINRGFSNGDLSKSDKIATIDVGEGDSNAVTVTS